jgi:hypothetical protein
VGASAVAADLVERVVRRFGLASASATSAAVVSVKSAAAALVDRVVRRFGLASASDASATASIAVSATGSLAGLELTWARSIASSSGGTSLHGSLDELRGAASRAGRSRVSAGRASRPRPLERSRGSDPALVRPLTSG